MKPLKTTDYAVSEEKFRLDYDANYDLYRTQPVPEDLVPYYESEDYISHTDAKKSLVDKLYQLVKRRALRTKAALVQKASAAGENTVLDIGCGTGSFLAYLNDQNFKGIGIEPNAAARELTKEKGVTCFKDVEAISTSKFNAITMWHVLEHVPDVNAQFQKLKSLLNKDGVVIIAVPNFNSYDADFYKEFWAAWDVPRHLWHFSARAIKKLAAESGFELVNTKPMWFDSFYVSLLSEKYKYGKTNYFRAFGIGLLSNLKAIKTGEFSSKIYILKQKTQN